MSLEFAKLYYGRSAYNVEAKENLPLPQEFDFAHPVECAKIIFAIMSNVSGGHAISNCRFDFSEERGSANLVANGVHVYYSKPNKKKLSVEEALKMVAERVEIKLGTVVTDQYGDGWKRAVWKESED